MESAAAFVGLSNADSTCFLNALLQALYHTHEFRRLIFAWRYSPSVHGPSCSSLLFQLQRLFAVLHLANTTIAHTKDVTKTFQWSDQQQFIQHDIHEMSRLLMSAIDQLMNAEGYSSPVSLYRGVLLDRIVCSHCLHESTRSDPFLDLSVDIGGHSSLLSCLSSFTAMEFISYRCSHCASTKASKQIKISEPPLLLTIQLKRFVYDVALQERVKLSDRVEFPPLLDLQPFIEAATIPHKYALFAVLMHEGSAFSGHYYSYIRPSPMSGWYEFNDSSVRALSSVAVDGAAGGDPQAACAYVIMYRRIDNEQEGWTAQHDQTAGRDLSANYLDLPASLISAVRAYESSKQTGETATQPENVRADITVRVHYCGHVHSGRYDNFLTVGAVIDEFVSRLPSPAPPASQLRLRRYDRRLQFAYEPYSSDRTLMASGFSAVSDVLMEAAPWPPFDPASAPLLLMTLTQTTQERQQVIQQLLHDECYLSPLHVLSSFPSLVRQAAVDLDGADGLAALTEAAAAATGESAENVRIVKLTREGALTLSPACGRLAALGVAAGDLLFVERACESSIADAHKAMRANIRISFNRSAIAHNEQPLLDGSLVAARSSTLGALKQAIAANVGLDEQQFALSRHGSTNAGGSRAQLKDLTASLESLRLVSGSALVVTAGRPLAVDEIECKLFIARFDGGPGAVQFEQKYDFPLSLGLAVDALKATVASRLGWRDARIWEKRGEALGRVLASDQPVAVNVGIAGRIAEPIELAAQEIAEPERITKADLLLFVCSPASHESRRQIVVRRNITAQAMCERLGDIAGASASSIAFAKARRPPAPWVDSASRRLIRTALDLNNGDTIIVKLKTQANEPTHADASHAPSPARGRPRPRPRTRVSSFVSSPVDGSLSERPLVINIEEQMSRLTGQHAHAHAHATNEADGGQQE